MTWARVSSIGIAVACALIIIANAPAVLTDPLSLAIAQIRVNAATSELTRVTPSSSNSTTEETLATKAK
jgi:hypothetical protein